MAVEDDASAKAPTKKRKTCGELVNHVDVTHRD
jgi:hypothetical protein